MNKRPRIFSILLLSLLFIVVLLLNIVLSSGKRKTDITTGGKTYKDEWQIVKQKEEKGLTKSAYEAVKKIYKNAQSEKNSNQIIKSLLHIMKYRVILEEDAIEKIISDLENEINLANSPTKQILNSILAEFYWMYYQNNRYKFSQRTETSEIVSDDIKTWDLRKFIDKISELYFNSLEDEETLAQIDIKDFYEIIYSDQYSSVLRPSLYDFLAYRCLTFFMNEQTGLTQPAYKFEIDDPDYFGNTRQFSKLKLQTKDTDSLKFKAIEIMQKITGYRIDDKDPAALIDIELKRLEYVYNNYTGENADNLYLTALKNLNNKYKRIPSSVNISYKIAMFYFTKSEEYQPGIEEDNKWYKKQAYDLCESSIKRFPDHFQTVNCVYLKKLILKKELNFKTEKAIIPGKPFLSLVEYRNVNKIYLKIIKLDNAQRKESYKRQNKGRDKLIAYYNSIKETYKTDIDLPEDKDFNKHSAQLKLPELETGYYIILIGTNKSFTINKQAVCYSPVHVSNISYFRRQLNDGSCEYHVFHRDTGKPLEGVNAQVYVNVYDNTLRSYRLQKREKYITDENGYFKIKSDYNSRNIYIEFINDKDNLFFNENIYVYKNNDSNNERVITHFFTDRSIYRPGQTIYYKGIVFKTKGKNNEILVDKELNINFYDTNWQIIEEITVKTNEYGTFSGKFTAPVGKLNGLMTIQAENTGYTQISVEEYKRPKFEVIFNPVTGSFKLDNKVNITGAAKAFAGSVVDNADVRYRVVRNVEYPYWYWWWGYYPQTSEMEITNGQVKTNEKGEFEIKFKAIPDRSISKDRYPVFYYTVYADVIDINGETRSNSTSLRVGTVALNINLDILDTISQQGKKSFKIISRNFNSQYEQSSGIIKIYKLKTPDVYFKDRLWEKPDKFLMTQEEFKKDFPHDIYNDENNIYKWEKQQLVYEDKYNTEKQKELVLNKLEEWEQGKYLIELKTADKFNTDINYYHYFTLFSETSSKMPLNDFTWFDPVKYQCKPGENALIDFGTSAQDSYVLYEVEQDKKIIKKEIINLNNQKKMFEIPVHEEHRGNFVVHFSFIHENRIKSYSKVINVPWDNKDLDISFESFRNKLYPGEKEQWKIKIKGKNKDKAAAEMVAALYDASLDEFKPHNWYFNIYPYYYSNYYMKSNDAFSLKFSDIAALKWNETGYKTNFDNDYLNWFGFTFYSYNDAIYFSREKSEELLSADEFDAAIVEEIEDKQTTKNINLKNKKDITEQKTIDSKFQDQKLSSVSITKPEQITIRKNFNETAFFYPHLTTNENGEIIVSFTIPESLTRWKMLGFVHTKDLEYGLIDNELVTQKDLMIMSNVPRFLRENDTIYFTAKISNMSEKELSGKAVLQLFDALTMKPVDREINNLITGKTFTVKKGQSDVVEWELVIPQGLQAVDYRITASADNFSDGEEAVIPVLSNRMLVTETLPLPVRGKTTTDFTMEKLLNAGHSNTLKHEKLTLEFTSNPAWYAVQSLPYLMEYPYECSEQIFAGFYANSLASHIINSRPNIKRVFESWKTSDALLSNLEKNQELKQLLLEETPWVLHANNESAGKKRLGLLFDLNNMSEELEHTLDKLEERQISNGGFSWFTGLPDDRYITRHIISGLCKLRQLNVKAAKTDRVNNMIEKGIKYLDDRMREDYQNLINNKIKLNQDNLWYTQVHYLYTRSFVTEIPVTKKNKKAYDYWISQCEKYWLDKNLYMQGMISIALYRNGINDTALDIIKALKENSITNPESGMYWKSNSSSYYWYQAPIETQSLLIEAFYEVANDIKSVDELKIWLLKQKQVQAWKTTKATTDACYALLLRGTDWLETDEAIEVNIGDIKIVPAKMEDIKMEAGTGYFKKSWLKEEIKENMANITISKNTDNVAWGALYWQYFEDLDRITLHETPLKLKKQVFLEENNNKGPVLKTVTSNTKLKPGDLLKIRITLSVDRDMEYIHMKDMRASCLEPVNVISTYKYQDGLWYYETTKDAGTNFFIPWLRKGTYVFEYPLRITHKGDFSNGITTIQSMYAPEFSSHSEGIRIQVR